MTATATTPAANGVRPGGVVWPHLLDWPAIRRRLAAAMTEGGLSQGRLEAAAGIGAGGLSRFLAGKTELSTPTLFAVARALDLSPEDLAGIEPAPAPPENGPAGVTIRHGDLRVSKLNPRNADIAIEELAASIAADGLLEPLIVRPLPPGAGGETWQIVAGERRFLAIGRLIEDGDWPEDRPVPCIVREGLDAAAQFRLALVENLQRQDMTPLEEAAAFARMTGEFGASVAEVADLAGRTERHVQYRLKLLDLCPEARSAVLAGILPASAARHIAVLDNRRQQSIVDRIRAGDLIAHEDRVRAAVIELSRPARRPDPAPEQLDIEDLAPAPAETEPGGPLVWSRAEATAEISTVQRDGEWFGGWEFAFLVGNRAGTSTPLGIGFPRRHQAEGAAASQMATALRDFLLRANTAVSIPDRQIRAATDLMAWANGIAADRGFAQIAMPGAPEPAPAFVRPVSAPNDPARDRDGPHEKALAAELAARDDAGPSLGRWRLVNCSTDEGPNGWPNRVTLKNKDTGRNATYRLIPEGDRT